MTRAIQQSVTLRANAQELFATFVDGKRHAAMTGASTSNNGKVGARWNAWGGSLWGTNLQLVPGRMIVQSWRSSAFKETDTDSILTITFTKAKGGTRVDLVHVNVPVQDHKGVTGGWKTNYWDSWREYLAKKR
jgi:activator of HSP90 ATPase